MNELKINNQVEANVHVDDLSDEALDRAIVPLGICSAPCNVVTCNNSPQN
jgi:hypothetical protein